MTPPRASRGFTLIELMVTVGVIGIATAIAVPSLRRAVADRALQSDAISFVQGFREARSRAMMRGLAQTVVTTVSGANGMTQQVFEGSSNSCVNSTWPGTLVYSVPLDTTTADTSDTRIRSIDPGQAITKICFTPFGHVFYTYGAAWDFTDGSGTTTGPAGGFMFEMYSNSQPQLHARRIFVSTSGSPRLQSW